jgi:hypothetical protein
MSFVLVNNLAQGHRRFWFGLLCRQASVHERTGTLDAPFTQLFDADDVLYGVEVICLSGLAVAKRSHLYVRSKCFSFCLCHRASVSESKAASRNSKSYFRSLRCFSTTGCKLWGKWLIVPAFAGLFCVYGDRLVEFNFVSRASVGWGKCVVRYLRCRVLGRIVESFAHVKGLAPTTWGALECSIKILRQDFWGFVSELFEIYLAFIILCL